MFAILRRELSSYFTSAVGFVFLAVFYAASGFFLYQTMMYYATADLSPVFGSMFTVLMFLIPLLTMRLWSEEKRQKTDQALLTSPVSLTGIILGKFFAAFIVFAAGVAMMLVYAVVFAASASPDWAVVFGNIVGLLLLGAALIALGLFVSSLTENQIIAAIGCFVIILLIFQIDSLASIVPFQWMKTVLSSISFTTRYQEFTKGLFNITSVIFFASVAVVFNFLTVRVLEKKRWS